MNLQVKDKHIFMLLVLAALAAVALFVHGQVQRNTVGSLRLLWVETSLQLNKAIPERHFLQGNRADWLLKARADLQRSHYMVLILQEGGSFQVAGQPIEVAPLPKEVVSAAESLETAIQKLRRQIDKILVDKPKSLTPSELLTLDVARRKLYQDLSTLEERIGEHQTVIAAQASFFSFACILFLLLALGALGYLLWELYLKPLTALAKKAERLAEGQTAMGQNSLTVLSEKVDAIMREREGAAVYIQRLIENEYDYKPDSVFADSKLGKALDGLKHKLLRFSVEEQHRLWKMSGISGLSDLFSRLQNDQAALGDILYEFTKAVCRHTQINQGAVFLVRQQGVSKWLELEACYAYEKRRYVNKKLALNEGLLGQCVQEQQSLYFEGLPDGFVSVTSGLGQATPAYLLQVPLIKNKEVIGVLELAAFKELEQHTREFVENACEKLAITLSMVRMNEETKRLLSASQKVNKQLKEKEEQMVIYNEQLNKEFEALSRKLTITQDQYDPTLVKEHYEEEIAVLSSELMLKKNMIKVYQQENEHLKQQSQTAIQKHTKLANKVLAIEKEIQELQEIEAAKNQQLRRVEEAFTLSESEKEKLSAELECLKKKYEYGRGLAEILFSKIPAAEVDADGMLVKVAPGFAQHFGYTPDEMLGVNLAIFLSENLEDRDRYRTLWKELQAGNTSITELNWLKKEQLEPTSMNIRFVPNLPDGAGKLKIIALVF